MTTHTVVPHSEIYKLGDLALETCEERGQKGDAEKYR